jgi:prepilin-type processing-associated H-X9-DG protein
MPNFHLGIMYIGSRASWDDFPASRHNGGAVVSFTDGHVIFKKWQDPRTRQPVTGNYLSGRAQPHNPDKEWLRVRTALLKPNAKLIGTFE